MQAITCAQIKRYAAEYGFSAAYCFPPEAEDRAPEGIQTLVLLAREYTPGGRLTDRFYPASNAAYHEAKRMAERISDETGVKAERLSELKMKPMCRRHPAFGTGKNTLNYLPGIGSRFCMELIGLCAPVESEECAAYDGLSLDCGTCDRCERVCPGGAISAEGFAKERCIRYYMMSGRVMPDELRGHVGLRKGACGIIGCDLCQRVCPANAKKETQRTEDDDFTLAELLDCDRETLARFAALYGKNYAVKNRIIAQALLTAANNGRAEYLERIRRLEDNPSALVAEYARWARKKLEEKG